MNEWPPDPASGLLFPPPPHPPLAPHRPLQTRWLIRASDRMSQAVSLFGTFTCEGVLAGDQPPGIRSLDLLPEPSIVGPRGPGVGEQPPEFLTRLSLSVWLACLQEAQVSGLKMLPECPGLPLVPLHPLPGFSGQRGSRVQAGPLGVSPRGPAAAGDPGPVLWGSLSGGLRGTRGHRGHSARFFPPTQRGRFSLK